MDLKEYNKKRDFSKTKEPKGVVKNALNSKKPKLIYCIQKHDASHLHYDLRLEMNGVLKSWAIPKEPPKEKGIKRLAVMTEDHPIGYEKFRGEIPKGEYGGGKVEIWDSGFYELKIKDEKKIEIILCGKKLKGNYVLVKTNFGGKGKSWLFFKV
ncbi:3'-phosphoesterase [Candidatus Pacearchaeota archaeon]|nr:3'-phosphoesterase [Candidatus Pacearchaeota archaeon]